MGDVVVEKDKTVEEASTGWGDVLVEGEVNEDVSSGFGDIRIEGPVGGGVRAGSGDVRINAPIGGDVKVGHGDVYLEGGAHVGGEVSLGNGNLYRHQEAVADTERAGMASSFDEVSSSEVFSDTIGWVVMTLGLVAAAVLLAVVAPGPLRSAARSLEGSPGRSLVLGLGSVPAVVVVSILLAVTGIGLLLLLLLWPAYLALLLFGALVAAYFLGRKVVLATGRYRAGDALAAAVGAVLVAAATLIPFLGGLVFAVLALLGTGAAISALLARRRMRGGPPRTTYASYEDYLKDRRD
jgi:cytoskeletal protein CcmA (bactofilin family)